MSFPTKLLLSAATILFSTMSIVQGAELRVAGHFSGHNWTKLVEQPFYTNFAKKTGLGIEVNYTPIDVLGLKLPEALRYVSTGTFDVVTVGIGNVAVDDPFLEGIDIAGTFPTLEGLREASDAFRPEVDRHLMERFNAKLMTLFPFGPQVLFCTSPIETIDDFKGKKIRTFTASMARLIQHLGATSITLQFPEVYTGLQRGVADCAVTAAAAGNQGKWPEVATHLIPLGLTEAVTAHIMNLDTWNGFSSEEQKIVEKAFRDLEDQMWDLTIRLNIDGINCNVGKEPCKEHKKFDMVLNEPTPAMIAALKEAARDVTLPAWVETCKRTEPECAKVWNRTVGKHAGIEIK